MHDDLPSLRMVQYKFHLKVKSIITCEPHAAKAVAEAKAEVKVND